MIVHSPIVIIILAKNDLITAITAYKPKRIQIFLLFIPVGTYDFWVFSPIVSTLFEKGPYLVKNL